MWVDADWVKEGYVVFTPTYQIDSIGFLPSLTNLTVGDIVEIKDAGNNKKAQYQVTSDGNLDLVFLQDGTLQFLPKLYDFAASGIGFDMSAFDSQAFDNDPAIELRSIIQVLNKYILIDNLSNISDQAFYNMLFYALSENVTHEWVFPSSFLTVTHKIKNLDIKTNYRKTDEQFIVDFINESKPFHTRVREFIPGYYSLNSANLHVSDFDIPSLYDVSWGADKIYPSVGKQTYLVQTSQFDNNVGLGIDDYNFYVSSKGTLTSNIGVFPNNVNSNSVKTQNYVFKIARTPSTQNINYVAGPKDIAIAINGIPIRPPYDVDSTETLVWRQNPAIEQTFTINLVYNSLNYGIDEYGGYPDENGAYHYITDPIGVYSKNPSVHSPIIGYSFDGYPIYGPYGYKNIDGTGGIIRNTSSYTLKNTLRLNKHYYDQNPHEGIINGTQLSEYNIPTGEYIEDYIYSNGYGTLDEFNGRFVVTPEYPNGTYAYFITVDKNNIPVYPYIMGPWFKGTPTGLRFEFANERNNPVYSNGNYKMPTTPVITKYDSLRSPSGTFVNDDLKLQKAPYIDWYNNHTYSVDYIDVYDGGFGYTQIPLVTIVGGGGFGATARAVLDVETQSVSHIIITNSGSNYISAPTVIIDQPIGTDPGLRGALAYAQISGTLARTITSEMNFDRISYKLNIFNNTNSYPAGEIVYDNSVFYRAIIDVNVGSTITDTTYWEVLDDTDISKSCAINRIEKFYEPDNTQVSKIADQLMTGISYPGVTLEGTPFQYNYRIPTGNLWQQEDEFFNKQSLNLSFNSSLVTDSVFTPTHKIAGNYSALCSSNGSGSYFKIDPSSPDITNLALLDKDFSLEFFFRLELLNSLQALLDLRNTNVSSSGLTVWVSNSNELCVGNNGFLTPLIVVPGLTNNLWMHVAIERKSGTLKVFLDGTSNSDMESIIDSTHVYYDDQITLGASVDGLNVLNGYIDELRLTKYRTRYYDLDSFQIPISGFGRDFSSDPYFLDVVVLWGAEGFANEAPYDINFIEINSYKQLFYIS